MGAGAPARVAVAFADIATGKASSATAARTPGTAAIRGSTERGTRTRSVSSAEAECDSPPMSSAV